jgi:hypothetical protein
MPILVLFYIGNNKFKPDAGENEEENGKRKF